MAAANKVIETHSKGAEIYHGLVCQEKLMKLLEEFSVPTGLMRLNEIQEMGFNRTTGFFWIRQNKKIEHKFKSIGKTVIYDVLITGFFEHECLKKITGVKARELLVPVTICDILVGVPSSDKIKFTAASGLFRAHPISAFEPEDGNDNRKLSQPKENPV